MTYGWRNRKPPMIRHIKPPDCTLGQKSELVRTAANNIRLSARATRLLAFYATASEGFRPALLLIVRRTKIPCNKVSAIRTELIRHNTIMYSMKSNTIWIHWSALMAFAMMEPIRKTEAMNPNNFPQMWNENISERIRTPIDADDWLKGYIRFINSTTKEEYEAVIDRFSVRKRGT